MIVVNKVPDLNWGHYTFSIDDSGEKYEFVRQNPVVIAVNIGLIGYAEHGVYRVSVCIIGDETPLHWRVWFERSYNKISEIK